MEVLSAKNKTRIGFWNARTIYETVKLAQGRAEMRCSICTFLELARADEKGPGRYRTNTGDNVLYSGRQRRSLQDVRVRRGADVGSEHHLVTRTLKLKLRRNGPRKARQQQFDVKWLKEPGAKSTFTLIRNHKFQELADAEKHTPPETNHINTMWEQIRTASHRPAKPAWDAD